MASPLRREISPLTAVVAVIVVLALVAVVWWYLSGGSSGNVSKEPARPLQPPSNLTIPQGAGGAVPPGVGSR